MSINLAREFKTAVADRQYFVGDNDIASCSVVCFSHLQHVFSVWLLKSQVWNQKFTHLGEQLAGKFKAVQVSSRGLFSVGNFYSAKDRMKTFNKWFIDAVNLQLEHILSKCGLCELSALADKETSVAIDQACKIDQVVSGDSTKIQSLKTWAHNDSFFVSADNVQYKRISVYRERLNNWTAKADAIVRSMQKCVEGGITRLPALVHKGQKSNRPVGSDQVQYVVQDRVLNESTKVLSLQLGLTLDTLIRDMLVSTSSTISCQFGSNGNTPTEITDLDIQTAVIALRQGNARLMTNPLPGENKFGTAPVRSSYWGFMSVDLQADLEAVSSFVSSANYPNPMNALEAEWGTTRNVRWLMNTNGYSTSDAIPIYSSFLVGQEAYGVVRLGAKEAEFIVKPLGASGTADPLNQRGTVGYKYPFATRILNDNWATQILSTI